MTSRRSCRALAVPQLIDNALIDRVDADLGDQGLVVLATPVVYFGIDLTGSKNGVIALVWSDQGGIGWPENGGDRAVEGDGNV